MGALANEGGLKRSDFGRIDIKPNFSLVELPPVLSDETLGKLAVTRISGILIDLQRDKGPAPRSGPPKRFKDGAGALRPSGQEATSQAPRLLSRRTWPPATAAHARADHVGMGRLGRSGEVAQSVRAKDS